MLHEKMSTTLIFLALIMLRFVCAQWEGYNLPACYYNSYAQTGYPYSYSQPEGYDCTSYGQAGYPYGAYILTGYYGNNDHGDIYDLPSYETTQPIIIVVENNDKYDEFTFNDLISLSLGLAKNPSKECLGSCTSTWCNCDCCDSRNNGRYEFYSECDYSPCNGGSSCNSCKKKGCNKKSCCNSECGYHNIYTDCCNDCGNCKHIMICECK